MIIEYRKYDRRIRYYEEIKVNDKETIAEQNNKKTADNRKGILGWFSLVAKIRILFNSKERIIIYILNKYG